MANERRDEFIEALRTLFERFDVELDSSDQYGGPDEQWVGKEYTIRTKGNWQSWTIHITLDELEEALNTTA